METLESSRVCRLCGQQSGISINIFDENENHVRKINAVLPIMVHEMDLLPKHMCHRCSYKLEEYHKFYMACLKTDAELKNQLSWMQKGRTKEKIGVPMVHIKNVNIKTEPLDYDVYELEPMMEQNINYLGTMTNPMAFSTGDIHDGLTYAAFSRYRCCCDKKDQSRRKAAEELCRNYEECGSFGRNSSRKTLETARLRQVKRKALVQAMLQDTQDHLRHMDAGEDARVRLTTAKDMKVFSLEARDRSHGRLRVVPESQMASKSTLVRNLRPRKNLVNYALNKKRSVENIAGPSVSINSSVVNSNTIPTLGFELTPQIKVEPIDELERRSLRPRKNVVDYYGPKTRKSSDLTQREQRKGLDLTHRVKKRKIDDMEQNSKLRSTDKNALDAVEIKQEVPDDLENVTFGGITSATSVLSKNIADLSTKIKALASNASVNLRKNDIVDYLKSNRSQSGNKFQVVKRKPIATNVPKNGLTASKKIDRLPMANYSPKCLRSQAVYLRNGKVRKYDNLDWSVKRLRTGKKLVDVVVKGAKKMPTMLELADSIKYYCETCNVSFMNAELFRLHACYYD